MWRCIISICVLYFATPICCIVNMNPDTANMVIYMRKPSELMQLSSLTREAIQCIAHYSKVFFEDRPSLTRAYNLMYTISINQTEPASSIQSEYLSILHNQSIATKFKKNHFRLAATSDSNKKTPFVRVRMPNDFYMIILDDVESLGKLLSERLTVMNSWQPGSLFFVLYHNAAHYDEQKRITDNIAKMLLRYFAQYIFILFARDEHNYVALVHNYLNNEQCRSIHWISVDVCQNGKPNINTSALRMEMLKFRKSYGKKNCTFNICASVSKPFIEPNCNDGLEIKLLGLVKQRLNMNINLSCSKTSRGILKNGSWNGLLGKLSAGDCDMVMGGFYPDNELMSYFWSSSTYLEDSHTWFVKLAEHRPPWQALITIFTGEVWLCFVLVLVITWLAWYFFVKMLPEPSAHQQLSLAAINAMAVSISVAVTERPLCYASRIFFYTLSLYGLNVMAIYTSRLIVVFKDSGHMHQLSTIEEVAKADIPFGGQSENSDWFENEDDEWILDQYNDSELFRATNENMLAVALGERVILGGRMFMLQSSLAERIYAFPQNVFSSPLQSFMTYSMPFRYSFNMLISYTNDFGIVAKITKDYYYQNSYLNRISKMRPVFEEKAIVLTLAHFQGPFAILVFGIICSCLVFVAELIFYNLLKLCSTKKSIMNSVRLKEKTELNTALWNERQNKTKRKKIQQKNKTYQKKEYTMKSWMD